MQGESEWTFSDVKVTIGYFRLDSPETGLVDSDLVEPEACNVEGPSEVKKYKIGNTLIVHTWKFIQNEKSNKLQIMKANKYLEYHKTPQK